MTKYLDVHLTIIISSLLTIAMLWPVDQLPPASAGSDKLVHLISFAALVFPLAYTGRFRLIPIVIGVSIYAGFIEIIQPRFNRGADIYDWIADIFGILIGVISGLIYRRRSKN